MRYFYIIGLLVVLSFSSVCCKKKLTNSISEKQADTIITTLNYTDSSDLSGKNKIKNEDIVGDTIWVYPYGKKAWQDTLSAKKYKVLVSVWVDTTSYLIDTVRSAKGNRIVIGYNQYYSLVFYKNDKPWIFLNFNKKDDLYSLIYGTDLWLESNLNAVSNIIYNEKFGSFIVELSCNSHDEFNSMFYLIVDMDGKIRHEGLITSWGGGSSDGTSFLTDDGRMYVTCNEVYNFVTGTAISLTEYASISQILSGKNNTTEYIQIHALRYLSDNNFLVIFNRFHNKPKYNALILNTDSLVVKQFGYYSLVEDIDAVLLYEEAQNRQTAYLYDTEREVLIRIKKEIVPIIKETGLYEMTEMDKYLSLPSAFQLINFGFYGPCGFYVSESDTLIYYSREKIH